MFGTTHTRGQLDTRSVLCLAGKLLARRKDETAITEPRDNRSEWHRVGLRE